MLRGPAIDRELGRLGTSESRNIVRRVRLVDDTEAVIKVIGNTREPGEGALLAAWHELGLPCLEPLDWGYIRVGEDGLSGVATYLMTRFVEGEPVRTDSLDDNQRRTLTLELVDFIAPFHRANARVATVRTWRARLDQHLRQVLPAIDRSGLPQPAAWSEKLSWISGMGTVTVHGDPAGPNVLRTDRGLVLMDPPGALRAVPEADLAQICFQTSNRDLTVLELIDLVCRRDRTVNPAFLCFFVAMNLLIVAGYLLTDHYNPDADASRSTQRSSLEAAEDAMRLSRSLAEQLSEA